MTTFYQELEGDAFNKYNEMISVMKQRARTQLGLTDSTMIVRSLRPEDLGLSTPKWAFTAWATSKATLTSGTIYKGRLVGVCGAFNGEAAGEGSQVTINVRSSDVAIWEIDPIMNFKHKIGYADEYVVIGEDETYTISGAAQSASTTGLIGFVGAVVERRGLLVNP